MMDRFWPILASYHRPRQARVRNKCWAALLNIRTFSWGYFPYKKEYWIKKCQNICYLMVWYFFNGLCLFVLPDIQENIFIQEATFILDVRVLRYLETPVLDLRPNFYDRSWRFKTYRYGYGGRSLRPFLRPKVLLVVFLVCSQNGGLNVFFITKVPP